MPDVNGSKITVAMHVHTLYSACAETKLEAIGDYCRQKGVDVLAVTDHDTISGALALHAVVGDLRLIIGEEIMTRQGEIVGLFLKKEIEPVQDAVETCKQIKEQGGLVYIPHPFDPFKIRRLKKRALMQVLDMVDIIEVYNAKTVFPAFSKAAVKFAKTHGKAAAVGSDAHYLEAIDICGNRIEDFSTPQEFLQNLRNADFITGRANSLRTWWVSVKNALSGEGHVLRRFGRD